MPRFTEEEKRTAFDAKFAAHIYPELQRARDQFRDACVRYKDHDGNLYKYAFTQNEWELLPQNEEEHESEEADSEEDDNSGADHRPPGLNLFERSATRPVFQPWAGLVASLDGS